VPWPGRMIIKPGTRSVCAAPSVERGGCPVGHDDPQDWDDSPVLQSRGCSNSVRPGRGRPRLNPGRLRTRAGLSARSSGAFASPRSAQAGKGKVMARTADEIGERDAGVAEHGTGGFEQSTAPWPSIRPQITARGLLLPGDDDKLTPTRNPTEGDQGSQPPASRSASPSCVGSLARHIWKRRRPILFARRSSACEM
jgi:hypothetical protein